MNISQQFYERDSEYYRRKRKPPRKTDPRRALLLIGALLIIIVLALPSIGCTPEHDYRKDWAGTWSSDANPDALYRFSLDGTWTGWSLKMPDEEQNNGTYSVTKDRYKMTYGAIRYGKSYYRYDAGAWEVIGGKLVLYEDPLEDGDKDLKVARIYTRTQRGVTRTMSDN